MESQSPCRVNWFVTANFIEILGVLRLLKSLKFA